MSRRGRTAICFLAMGQSLAANGAMPREPRFKARHGAVNFFDGKCYRAEDPLLGGGGDGNAIWTILADRLIGQGGYNSAVAAVFAEGGTTVEDWAFYPAYVQRAAAIDAQMRKAGLHLSAVLWMQGEEDFFRGGRLRSNMLIAFALLLRRYGRMAFSRRFMWPKKRGAHRGPSSRSHQLSEGCQILLILTSGAARTSTSSGLGCGMMVATL